MGVIGARLYAAEVGQGFLSVDPLAQDFAAYSGYNYVLGNPISLIDPDGRSATSTHTDKDGNVVAVYQDGDNGVYRHESLPDEFAATGSGSGQRLKGSDGELMGETLYWDEFVDTYTGGLIEDMKISFGTSWDEMIDFYHGKAQSMSLVEVAQESTNTGLFSIQDKNGLTKEARLLNGFYATSRSAGNYLAGYNAAGRASFAGFDYDTFQRLAGALHYRNHTDGGRLAKDEMALIAAGSHTYGSFPLYGELEYQYRMSTRGWAASGNSLKNNGIFTQFSEGHKIPARTY
ncbi:MAG: hypothetical protein AAF741_05545 [Bacteroidota bacterium]